MPTRNRYGGAPLNGPTRGWTTAPSVVLLCRTNRKNDGQRKILSREIRSQESQVVLIQRAGRIRRLFVQYYAHREGERVYISPNHFSLGHVNFLFSKSNSAVRTRHDYYSIIVIIWRRRRRQWSPSSRHEFSVHHNTIRALLQGYTSTPDTSHIIIIIIIVQR